MKNDFAKQLHPDKFGGAVPTTQSGHILADINAAIDLLNNNLANGTGVNAAKATPATAKTPAMPTIDEIATVLDDYVPIPGATEAQLSQIRQAARASKYNSNIVLENMEKHPDVVDRLVTCKAPDGSPLFNAQEISDFLYNCNGSIEENKEVIFAILNNSDDIALINRSSNKSFELLKKIYD